MAGPALVLTLDTTTGFGGANSARAAYSNGSPAAGDTIANAELAKLVAVSGIGTNFKSFINTTFTSISGGLTAAQQAAAAAKKLRFTALSSAGADPATLVFTCVSGQKPTATITTIASTGSINFGIDYSASR